MCIDGNLFGPPLCVLQVRYILSARSPTLTTYHESCLLSAEHRSQQAKATACAGRCVASARRWIGDFGVGVFERVLLLLGWLYSFQLHLLHALLPEHAEGVLQEPGEGDIRGRRPSQRGWFCDDVVFDICVGEVAYGGYLRSALLQVDADRDCYRSVDDTASEAACKTIGCGQKEGMTKALRRMRNRRDKSPSCDDDRIRLRLPIPICCLRG